METFVFQSTAITVTESTAAARALTAALLTRNTDKAKT